MSNIVRSSNPFSSLMDEVFGNNYNLDRAAVMNPSVDIRENDDSYVISVDLPGMEKKDVNVTVENDMLRISGERKDETTTDEKGYHYSERSFGSFKREFRLPDDVQGDKTTAKMKNGVLEIDLKKSGEKKSREIDISVK
ncbi:MAG: Hsp20/alpha crystallin family protein [Fibrobacterota bacterium]